MIQDFTVYPVPLLWACDEMKKYIGAVEEATYLIDPGGGEVYVYAYVQIYVYMMYMYMQMHM